MADMITPPETLVAKKQASIKTVAKRCNAIVAKETAHKRKQDDLEAEKKALELERMETKKEEIQLYHDVLNNVLGSMMRLVKRNPGVVDEMTLRELKTKIAKAGEVVDKALATKTLKVQDVGSERRLGRWTTTKLEISMDKQTNSRTLTKRFELVKELESPMKI